MHWTWTGDSFHIRYYTCFNAILPNHPTLSLSHRVQKTVLYICVSFAVSHTGLSLPSFFIFYNTYAAAAAKLRQSCPTLCDPIDGSPPGSPVPGILQARTLEWVAISSSNAWKWKGKVKLLSLVRLFETPCAVAHQASPSMGFSWQEYWSRVPLPSLRIPILLVYKVLWMLSNVFLASG